MKPLIIFALLALSACATRPANRTEAQSNYAAAERETQDRSRERADHASRVIALAAQARAIDTQIANQRLVISKWQAMGAVPSAPAMIRNARLRIKQLTAEKDELLRQQAAELEEVEDLREEEP